MTTKNYKTDLLDIRNMDCMELMKQYEDNYFDLAIVDPPYRDKNQPDQFMRANGSMKPLDGRPTAQYWFALKRVSKNQIIWGANNFMLPQWKGFVFWRKTGINNDVHFSCGEIASISEDLGTTCKVFECSTNTPGKVHPTQKPVKLYNWLLSRYAEKGQKILDTHMGSGSIAIACHYAECPLVACELDEDYYNAAVDRIKRETSQLTLF